MVKAKVKVVNWLFLATILMSIAGSFIVMYISENVTDNGFYILLLSQILLVLPSIIYVAANRINIKQFIRFNRISIGNAILHVILAYTLIPVISFINLISMYFAKNHIQGTVTDIADRNSVLVSLFVIALIPAVMEETVYRGVFYNEYRKVSQIKGMLLSAFLFGLVHMNINQFLYAFVLGSIFAFLIEATDSIISSMIVHFVINGNSVILTYLLGIAQKLLNNKEINEMMADSNQMTSQDITDSLFPVAIMAVVGLVLSIILIRTIAKNAGRYEQLKEIFSIKKGVGSKRMITIPLIIGCAICLFIIVVNELAVAM